MATCWWGTARITRSAACAGPGADLVPGRSTLPDVQASMGTPSEKIAEADGGQTWFYSQGPLVAQTYAVHLDRDGVVKGVEPTRVPRNIQQLRAGSLTDRDVRSLLGLYTDVPCRVGARPSPPVTKNSLNGAVRDSQACACLRAEIRSPASTT